MNFLEQLFAITVDESKGMATYLAEITNMREEVRSMTPSIELQDIVVVTIMLRGLPQSFATTKALLGDKPPQELTLGLVRQRLLEAETNLKIEEGAFNVKNKPPSKRPFQKSSKPMGGSNAPCKHCGKTNHTPETLLQVPHGTIQTAAWTICQDSQLEGT